MSRKSGSESFTEAAIFSRVVEQSGDLSRDIAEHVLSLGFSSADQKRVEHLFDKSASDGLTPDERTELDNLSRVADLLSIWHSRALRVLKPPDGVSRSVGREPL